MFAKLARLALGCAVALVLAGPVARAEQGKKNGNGKDKGSQLEARLQFYAAEAALYSAIAHAEALEKLAEETSSDRDLARTYVHTINRDTNACNGDSVKMGQAVHSLEKEKSMKELRKHLTDAMKAIDEAQEAVDGHGKLAPAVKNAHAALMKALDSLKGLADPVSAKPLGAPGGSSK